MKINNIYRIIKYLFIILVLCSSISFAADYTVNLQVGETSQVYTTDATTANIVDTSIATMTFNPSHTEGTSSQDLEELCWEFEKYSSGYYIKTNVNGTTMYLDPNTFTLVTNHVAIMVDKRNNNAFSIRRGNKYIEYVNGVFQNRNGLANHSSFEFYRQTSDPANYSTDIPGYERLTEVGNGGNILIVARDGNNLICFTPSHIATGTTITTGTYTQGSVSFTGVSTGTTIATVGNDNYTINVLSSLEDKITIDTDSHTSVYYSENYNSLTGADNNEVLTFNRLSNEYKAYNFFGVPESGYALVKINNNMTVINNDTATDIRNNIATNYIQSLYSLSTGYSKDQVATHIESGLSMNAEGINGYTVPQNTSTSITETIVLRSEKLPTIDLKIYSIDGVLFEEGMKPRSGSTIIYEVTVDKDEAGQFLNIENGVLNSSLTGASYVGTTPEGNETPNSINIALGDTFNEKYYFSYIVPNNLTTVNNTVTLNYKTYSSSLDTSNNVSYKIDRELADSTSVNVDNNSVITIKNNVYGNLANPEKYFKYKVIVNGPVGDTISVNGQDSTISYDGQTINTNSTIIVGQDNYIYVKDGQEITINIDHDLVNYIGNTFSIEQVDGIEYETTINGNSGKTTGSIEINNYTASFVNYKEKSPDTGLFVDLIPYILIISIIFCGFIVIKKEKINK